MWTYVAEALFANTRDELCEGTGSNVLLARDGCLVTPPLTSGALAGITRATGPPGPPVRTLPSGR